MISIKFSLVLHIWLCFEVTGSELRLIYAPKSLIKLNNEMLPYPSYVTLWIVSGDISKYDVIIKSKDEFEVLLDYKHLSLRFVRDRLRSRYYILADTRSFKKAIVATYQIYLRLKGYHYNRPGPTVTIHSMSFLGLPAKFPVDKSTYVYGPKDRPLKISWNLGVWDDANLKWIVRLDRLRKQASVIKSSKRLYQFSTIEYNHADFVTKKRIAYHVRDTLIYRYNYTINFYVPPSDLIDGAAYRVTIVQGYNKYLMQTIKKVFRVRVERKKEKEESSHKKDDFFSQEVVGAIFGGLSFFTLSLFVAKCFHKQKRRRQSASIDTNVNNDTVNGGYIDPMYEVDANYIPYFINHVGAVTITEAKLPTYQEAMNDDMGVLPPYTG